MGVSRAHDVFQIDYSGDNLPGLDHTPKLVSFPDPFCARARNLKLGGGERPGKGSGKSSRPSTGNGRNAGAVRMECS